MKPKLDYQSFTRQLTEIKQTTQPLARLGIYIDFNGAVSYAWQKVEHINKVVSSKDFFDELTFKEKLTLQLAEKQESQNGYIQQDQIDLVNKFFAMDITFDLVQKFNSEYI
jgi:hypothetical protein